MSEHHNIQNKMVGAIKWSFFGECAAKLVTPLTNMVLARILSPDDFGLLSIVTMITSFADMFTDAGFQKYLVQHHFQSEEELHEYASVAFWTNLFVTSLIWLVIVVIAVPLTVWLNKPGYQWVIRIGSMKLFLTAFTSVQRAIYQRSFDYKTLFYVRMAVAMVPIVITIPLALIGFDYWALIIGTLFSEFLYALILTIKSEWKPNRYYSLGKLKKMFSFSIWSLVEQFTIWLSCYADTLILSIFLTDYMVGMYTQPESTISSIFNVFAASIFGILFSALSRYNDQKDEKGFWNVVKKTQLSTAILVFPLSAGIYLYRELITEIMLGAQWQRAIIVVGLLSLSTGVQVVMNNTASEIYRAKGEPKTSVLAQLVYILCLIPISVMSVRHGFETFVRVRACMSIVFMLIHYSIIKIRYHINIGEFLNNVKSPLIATVIMYLIVRAIQLAAGELFLLKLLGIPAGVVVYIFAACRFQAIRGIVVGIIDRMKGEGWLGRTLYRFGKMIKLYEQ